jgi:hypothetical protein
MACASPFSATPPSSSSVTSFEKRPVRADDVPGAACGDLLAGVVWSQLFQVRDLLSPGSFSISTAMVGQLSTPPDHVAVFNYFIVATLTTIAYADITPARGSATAFAMLETVFGQSYIAVVVAQLVGIRLAQAGRRFRGK